jgi:hypothetical protein
MGVNFIYKLILLYIYAFVVSTTHVSRVSYFNAPDSLHLKSVMITLILMKLMVMV